MFPSHSGLKLQSEWRGHPGLTSDPRASLHTFGSAVRRVTCWRREDTRSLILHVQTPFSSAFPPLTGLTSKVRSEGHVWTCRGFPGNSRCRQRSTLGYLTWTL